jgi:hypothetical protein
MSRCYGASGTLIPQRAVFIFPMAVPDAAASFGDEVLGREQAKGI